MHSMLLSKFLTMYNKDICKKLNAKNVDIEYFQLLRKTIKCFKYMLN